MDLRLRLLVKLGFFFLGLTFTVATVRFFVPKNSYWYEVLTISGTTMLICSATILILSLKYDAGPRDFELLSEEHPAIAKLNYRKKNVDVIAICFCFAPILWLLPSALRDGGGQMSLTDYISVGLCLSVVIGAAIRTSVISARIRELMGEVAKEQITDAGSGTSQNKQVESPQNESDSAKSFIQSKQKRKVPSKDAIKAFRLCQGLGKTQKEAAALLNTKQWKVSRWINEVSEWMKAGNVLPEMEGMTRKPDNIDPAILDMGPRSDRLTLRQRNQAE